MTFCDVTLCAFNLKIRQSSLCLTQYKVQSHLSFMIVVLFVFLIRLLNITGQIHANYKTKPHLML